MHILRRIFNLSNFQVALNMIFINPMSNNKVFLRIVIIVLLQVEFSNITMPFNIIRLQQSRTLKQSKSLSCIIQDIISACQIVHIGRIIRIYPKAFLKTLQSLLKFLTNAIRIPKIVQTVRLIGR